MRKGAEFPVNFVMIVAICVVTLFAVLYFFSGQTESGAAGASSIQASSHCAQLCFRDNTAIDSTINFDSSDFDKEDDCNEELAPNFCDGSYALSGEEKSCYELSSCSLADRFGNTCTVKCSD